MNDIKYGRKRKGIRKELREQVGAWLATIKKKKVRELAEKNTIVTGGAICSMLMGDKVNDYDVYFKDFGTTFAVAKYYAKKFSKKRSLVYGKQVDLEDIEQASEKDDHTSLMVPLEVDVCVLDTEIANCKGDIERRVSTFVRGAGVIDLNDEEFKNSSFRPLFLSENAITLSNKMQLVTRFYGEPTEIHNNYDFAHAKCYYDYANDYLHLDPSAMEYMLSRTLKYEGSLYPIASIFRMKKFMQRGWRITAGEQLKIMWQISELDLKNKYILKEQLTGVDMAYMGMLINALKDANEQQLKSDYVIQVIDNIFG